MRHFRAVLESGRKGPGVADTEPTSPMEKKVLGWLRQTQLMQRFWSHIDIEAQYPIGAYLRQLDSTYQHPAYDGRAQQSVTCGMVDCVHVADRQNRFRPV